MNDKPRKLPIQVALTVPFVLLTALAMGLSGYLAHVNGREAVDNAIHHLRGEIANRIDSQLHAFFNVPFQINRLNADAIGRGALRASDTKALERHFIRQIDVFESVSSVYMGNAKGGLVNSGREPATDARYVIGTAGFAAGVLEKHAIDAQGNRTALLASVADFDARKRPWYAPAIEKSEACWSPVYVLSTGQDMAITASYPVIGADSEVLGVVAADVFLSHIRRFLHALDVGAHGHCFIVERTGLLVASTADEKPFVQGTGGTHGQRLHARQSQSAVIRIASTLMTERFPNGGSGSATATFTVDDQQHFVKFATFQNGNGLDWIVGIVIAEADFLSPIALNTDYTILLGVLAFFLATGLGLVAARQVARPVLNLHAASRFLGTDQQPESVPEDSRIGELSDLTRAFNEMAARLRETMDRLSLEIEGHKRAEAALQESERHFRLLFDGNQDAVFLHLIDDQGRPGRFIQANDAACRRLGYTREQLLAMTPLDIAGPQMAAQQAEVAARLQAQGTVLFETVHLTRDGTCIAVESNVRRMTITGRDAVLSTSRDIRERKRLEQALVEGERNFRAFVESIAEMIMVADLDGRIVYANPALARALDYDPARVIGMNVLDLHAFDRRQEAQTIFDEMARGLRDVCPLPLVTRTGDLIPVETRVWRGVWSGADCIFGLSRDLRREQELLQMFDRMFRHNPALMAVSSIEPSRRFLDINNAFLTTFGYAKEEVIGKNVTELGLFVAQDKQEELADRLRREGRFANVELQVRCKDGAVRNGLFSGERIETQGKTYFLTVMVDITGLRHTQELLRQSEDRWRFALEGAGDGIWDWNAVTNEVYYSHRWKEMLGYADEDIGTDLSEWDQRIHPEDRDRVYAAIDDHFAGRTPVYVSEHRLKCKDGAYKWILDRGKVIQRTPDGQPLRVIGTHTDITERKHLEKKVHYLEKTESLGRMAGAIAHHFNNQLAVVQGNLELAMGDLPVSTATHCFLMEAMLASRKASEISGLMLTYLGQNVSQREILDLSDVCRQHLPRLRNALPAGIDLVAELMDKGPLVAMSAMQLGRVLDHLVTNGAEALGDRPGSVTVTTGILSPSAISLTSILPIDWQPGNGNWAYIEVKDTGPGINEDDIAKVFDPFFSTKFTGRGLGLAVVLGIVKAGDGAIAVQSRKDRGTVFQLFLPLVESKST